MTTFKIVKLYQAERCEICHQSGCYDAVNNYCYRCQSNLSNKLTSRVQNQIQVQTSTAKIESRTVVNNQSSMKHVQDMKKLISWLFLIVLGFLLALCGFIEGLLLNSPTFMITAFLLWGCFSIYVILVIAE